NAGEINVSQESDSKCNVLFGNIAYTNDRTREISYTNDFHVGQCGAFLQCITGD
ncbi:6937_t:CDS:1, partial [Acaulospora morrowiae]